ncbi:hypothetical protein ACFU46_32105 [Streptomyces griseoincarnatus]
MRPELVADLPEPGRGGDDDHGAGGVHRSGPGDEPSGDPRLADAEAGWDGDALVVRDGVDDLSLAGPDAFTEDVLDEAARGVVPEPVHGAGGPLDFPHDVRPLAAAEVVLEGAAAGVRGGAEQDVGDVGRVAGDDSRLPGVLQLPGRGDHAVR